MSASATRGGHNEVPTLYRCSSSTRVRQCKIPTPHNPVHAFDRGADVTVTHQRRRMTLEEILMSARHFLQIGLLTHGITYLITLLILTHCQPSSVLSS